MPTGQVKWFNEAQGHGLIAQDDGGPEVVVHHGDVPDLTFDEALRPGERVQYDLRRTAEGTRAVNVRRLDLRV